MTTAIALLAHAREMLAGAPREILGALIEPRRLWGVARAPRIVPCGEAWHLGVLLVTGDGVLATGEIVRSREQAPRGYTAESQRARAQLAGAAFRGGIPEGRAVHVGWTVLDAAAVDRGAASGPLALVSGVPSVRWSAAGGHVPLESYLDERIALLRDPPPGAN